MTVEKYYETTTFKNYICGFGTLIASTGRKYHWKLKVCDGAYTNIGIVEAEKYT